MKNLLNWNNFVAVSENSNGSYNLEFHVDGLLIVIAGAELTESVTVNGVPQHPLKYWYQEKNIKRAIEWAEPEDVEVIGELDELDAEEDIKSILAAKDFEGILDEIADITADLENNSTDLAKRLDSVALTAKQLADLGEMLLTNKETLEFQIHALGLVKTPKEVNNEELIVHYYEVYRLTDDMFRVNQAIVKRIDEVAFLLLESTNKDEIEAHYNK